MLQLKNSDLFCTRCFVNDEWIDADSGKTIEVTNPATGDVLGTVPYCGAMKQKGPLMRPMKAWMPGEAKPPGNALLFLRKWHDLLMENQEDLAVIMTAEQGKPLAESRGEIAYADRLF